MLSVDHSEHLTDPVRDSRLQASFRSDGRNRYTVHTHTISHRTRPRREVWMHKRDLGQGGFGIIQLQAKDATDRGAAEFRVIKSVRVSDGDLAVKRALYVRELEAMVKFSHQKYTDFFVTFYGWYDSPGWIHIAMEYCELGDFQSYLANPQLCPEGRLPEDQVQDITSQVLDALSLMHGENFAHRDLKPANILIKKQPPDSWWIKLCDLGLSKRIEDNASTAIRGTPGFMPPEILGYSGNPKAVDACLGDMWCLGELVFQTLTSQATFDNYAELGKYCSGMVTFPTQALRDVKASESAIEFVTALMQSKPSERLSAQNARSHAWMETDSTSQTSEEFSQTLVEDSEWSMDTPFWPQSDDMPLASAEWTETVTVMLDSSTATQTTAQEFKPQSQNVPQASTEWTETIALIPTSTLSQTTVQEPETTVLTSETPVPLVDHPDDKACQPDKAFAASLRSSLANVSIPDEAEEGIPGPPNSPMTFGQKQEESAADIAAKQLEKALKLAQDVFNDKRYPEAECICREAIKAQEATLGQESPALLQLQSFLGSCIVFQLRFEDGEQVLHAVLEAQRKVSGEEDLHAIMTQSTMATSLFLQQRYTESETRYREVLKVRERIQGLDNNDTLVVLFCLGESIRFQERFQEAEVIHRKAYEARKRVFGADHTHSIESLWVLGELCRFQDRIAEAEQIHREAAKISELAMGKDHLQALQCLYSVGETMRLQSNFKEAEKIYRSVFESRERLVGTSDSFTLQSLSRIGFTLEAQDKDTEAEEIYRKVAAMGATYLGSEKPEVLQYRHDLARNLYNLDKYDEAKTLCQEVSRSREKILGNEHSDTLSSLQLLGEICLYQEKFKESEEIHRKVLQIREKVNGRNDANTLISLKKLATALSKQGKHLKAEQLARDSVKRHQKTFGVNDPRTLDQIDFLAETLSDQERYSEAETLYRDCLAEKKRVLGKKNKSTIMTMRYLGTLLCGKKEYKEGIQVLRQAASYSELTLGADFWLTKNTKELIALYKTLDGGKRQQAGQ
ncbi:kinase-like domain-containing protein [Dactylonectria estremocensis]|uniref:Kinase-like domain-containing protein n=1 Tax=Dactylonectria estremocensis TaxID=1079267 RepID=A0A9P9DZD0_9HYPO|nr:kinase-like domain-containing protein [Dactylonectria estremocensis]